MLVVFVLVGVFFCEWVSVEMFMDSAYSFFNVCCETCRWVLVLYFSEMFHSYICFPFIGLI